MRLSHSIPKPHPIHRPHHNRPTLTHPFQKLSKNFTKPRQNRNQPTQNPPRKIKTPGTFRKPPHAKQPTTTSPRQPNHTANLLPTPTQPTATSRTSRSCLKLPAVVRSSLKLPAVSRSRIVLPRSARGLPGFSIECAAPHSMRDLSGRAQRDVP